MLVCPPSNETLRRQEASVGNMASELIEFKYALIGFSLGCYIFMAAVEEYFEDP